MKLILILTVVVLILATQANAWFGGQLYIKNITEGEIMSGNKTFEVGITGLEKVSTTYIYGKAVDTDIPSFTIVGKNDSCGQWNNQSSCNVKVDTTLLEDSSLWQFYPVVENASDSSDKIKSVTTINILVNNTLPSFQPDPFISPANNEIINYNDVKFGALVNAKSVTTCIITFTSNVHPGKRVYSTEYEKGEYCNLTITDVPEGSYSFSISASDGKDITPNIGPYKFEVRSPKGQAIEKPVATASAIKSTWLAENWLWMAAIAVLFLYFKMKKRRR